MKRIIRTNWATLATRGVLLRVALLSRTLPAIHRTLLSRSDRVDPACGGDGCRVCRRLAKLYKDSSRNHIQKLCSLNKLFEARTLCGTSTQLLEFFLTQCEAKHEGVDDLDNNCEYVASTFITDYLKVRHMAVLRYAGVCNFLDYAGFATRATPRVACVRQSERSRPARHLQGGVVLFFWQDWRRDFASRFPPPTLSESGEARTEPSQIRRASAAVPPCFCAVCKQSAGCLCTEPCAGLCTALVQRSLPLMPCRVWRVTGARTAAPHVPVPRRRIHRCTHTTTQLVHGHRGIAAPSSNHACT